MKRGSRTHRHRRYVNRNRAWDTRQNTFALTLKSAVFIVAAAFVGVAWLLARHSADGVYDEIKAEESRKIALIEEVNRETVKWNKLKTPAGIAGALHRHGIAMSAPRRAQYVAVHSVRSSAPFAAASATYAANR
ncbi:MAG: hypothetical protein IJ783_07710 [Kiritimatiellae bacterium]|nr:hypothetical protein [Kiritimatiellia bacterium]